MRLIIAALLACSLWGADSTAPYYTSASIVNAASYSASALAPDAIATIYGANLSYITQAASGEELPFSLGGVTVYVSGFAAGLYFVSPTQINFLIPALFNPATLPIVVARDGQAGPTVEIVLNPAGPALFPGPQGAAIATHLNGKLLTPQSPAQPGEWVVVYAEGLGPTIPPALNYTAAGLPAPIKFLSQFSLLLNGAAVGSKALNYVGIAPGWAGLYQINLQLPLNVAPNPQIQISVGSQTSAGQLQLPVQ